MNSGSAHSRKTGGQLDMIRDEYEFVTGTLAYSREQAVTWLAERFKVEEVTAHRWLLRIENGEVVDGEQRTKRCPKCDKVRNWSEYTLQKDRRNPEKRYPSAYCRYCVAQLRRQQRQAQAKAEGRTLRPYAQRIDDP